MREASPQLSGELGHQLLRHREGVRERLARQIIGGAAEPAGDDQTLDAHPLAVDELRDRRDLVLDRGGEHHRDTERFELAGKPGGVRVRHVARDDLVADRQQRGAHLSARGPAAAPAPHELQLRARVEGSDLTDRQLEAVLERLDKIATELARLNRRQEARDELGVIARELRTLNESLQTLAYAALGQQGPQVRRRRSE